MVTTPNITQMRSGVSPLIPQKNQHVYSDRTATTALGSHKYIVTLHTATRGESIKTDLLHLSMGPSSIMGISLPSF